MRLFSRLVVLYTSLQYDSVVARDNRPNILILLTDDQDVMLGGFDHMPHLRELVQEQGMTFENAFVHTPICCPSRSSILSGRFIHHGGAVNNSLNGNCYGESWRKEIENEHTFAVHAKQAGYSTAYAGKYLNRYGEGKTKYIPNGWDQWLGLVGNSVYYNYDLVHKNKTVQHHGKEYSKDYLPDVLINHTLSWMDHMPEPWLMVVAWPTPHGPFTPADWAKDTMNGTKAPVTENYNASDTFQQQKHWLIRQLQPISNETATEVNKYYQMRLEALQSVDLHVEKLITKLHNNNQLNDTVIMYTSDNGFQFGQHRLAMDKRHLYENDIRVPFVIRGPNIPPNTTSTQLLANIDIAPTILDITQQPMDPTIDGVSFWQYVQGSSDGGKAFDKRRDLLISYHGEGYAECGGFATCPPEFSGVWWEPDSSNNTYNCLRTVVEDENSIYCRFDDDQNFVEFYDLIRNPQQLDNNYFDLEVWQRQRYEHRLQELLDCKGISCYH